MEPIRFHKTEFVTGAASLSQMPADAGLEVAFAGRSNAGKSSALNTITGIRSLARTSKTPGRTQQINFFQLNDGQRLVDLPGYGYARAPEAVRDRWLRLIGQYLQTRRSLAGLVLVMDCRHPLKPFDRQLLQWCREARLPVHILLSKADKLGRGMSQACLHQVRRALKDGIDDGADKAFDRVTVQLFSSLNRQGLDEARQQIETWLCGPGGHD